MELPISLVRQFASVATEPPAIHNLEPHQCHFSCDSDGSCFHRTLQVSGFVRLHGYQGVNPADAKYLYENIRFPFPIRSRQRVT
jgi:hypothetical protein